MFISYNKHDDILNLLNDEPKHTRHLYNQTGVCSINLLGKARLIIPYLCTSNKELISGWLSMVLWMFGKLESACFNVKEMKSIEICIGDRCTRHCHLPGLPILMIGMFSS